MGLWLFGTQSHIFSDFSSLKFEISDANSIFPFGNGLKIPSPRRPAQSSNNGLAKSKSTFRPWMRLNWRVRNWKKRLPIPGFPRGNWEQTHCVRRMTHFFRWRVTLWGNGLASRLTSQLKRILLMLKSSLKRGEGIFPRPSVRKVNGRSLSKYLIWNGVLRLSEMGKWFTMTPKRPSVGRRGEKG